MIWYCALRIRGRDHRLFQVVNDPHRAELKCKISLLQWRLEHFPNYLTQQFAAVTNGLAGHARAVIEPPDHPRAPSGTSITRLPRSILRSAGDAEDPVQFGVAQEAEELRGQGRATVPIAAARAASNHLECPDAGRRGASCRRLDSVAGYAEATRPGDGNNPTISRLSELRVALSVRSW